MDASQFRVDLPEFSDSTRFPDSQINRWLSIAGIRLNAELWGDLLDYGTELFIAHNLTIWRENADTAIKKGAVGIGVGVVSSKSVDSLSISYDSGDSIVQGAAQWNLTTYGIQFIQLARQIGMGGQSQINSGAIAIPNQTIGYGIAL